MKGLNVKRIQPDFMFQFISYFDDSSNKGAGEFSTQFVLHYLSLSTILVAVT